MVTTLTGQNLFLVEQEAKRCIGAFVAEFGDIAIERIDVAVTDVESLRDIVQVVPFFSPKRLVVMRGIAQNKDLNENINYILDSIPESTDVLIIAPKLDKRSTLYKALKSHPEWHELRELNEAQLAQWLVGQAKQLGATLSLSDARYLVYRVGTDQLLLMNELQKLTNYELHITKETIDTLTDYMPRENVFALLEAAFSGDVKGALELYEGQRAQKVEPIAILAMIGWQLHVLVLVQAAGARSAETIAQESRISPFVIKKTQRIAQRTSAAHVKRIVGESLVLDTRLKSESIDADDALRYLLVRISKKI